MFLPKLPNYIKTQSADARLEQAFTSILVGGKLVIAGDFSAQEEDSCRTGHYSPAVIQADGVRPIAQKATAQPRAVKQHALISRQMLSFLPLLLLELLFTYSL